MWNFSHFWDIPLYWLARLIGHLLSRLCPWSPREKRGLPTEATIGMSSWCDCAGSWQTSEGWHSLVATERLTNPGVHQRQIERPKSRKFRRFFTWAAPPFFQNLIFPIQKNPVHRKLLEQNEGMLPCWRMHQVCQSD